MVVSSSTPKENLHGEETADAPLGGASPQTVESVEEQKQELPTVTDCTTLTLVDDVQSQPASLLNEKQDLGVEPGTSHEGHISAPPVAPGFEHLVTHSEEPAEYSQPAPLLSENQDLGDEPGTSHEGTGSVPSIPDEDKWSSEAIAKRSKARPWRMEKLKMAGLLQENPGLDFLMECWQDDPALQIVIKGLVQKCPQWGYVVVDGQLIEWEK
ncbi:hypothetical protein GNE08_28105 (plasmid) [Trichormus variabilis ARAD]|nr:hypothetical protein [Trichormus variabilis ARAD]MBC1259241.1 hypothetical protein [Trichormus variabilis V5]MBC1270837.1 hypothetical protein [Trichormus variabilis FSR]MBC1305748.1 hypothetical protein [Trichormus variabilis N2B]MBC1314740.1 hypothetical protein [Trichormus variabilis PNB]MBC1330013.1 hypothetical protein [Trichormus variabilis 9RC]MBD2383710.1 hypothetical protein [Trichormus variabilis FACHB-319]QFZ16023.1 hypothetical protein EH233_27160 [Anabaena sp. YBS01]QHD83687